MPIGNRDIICQSREMEEISFHLHVAAQSEITTCILGESGTGKELAARTIHANSGRRNHPFIVVNCGAIPKNLVESEFFGHEKGAFTGTASRHKGYFEQAHLGTLFLDEIAEMPIDLQTRLLRSLEYQKIRRVGGSEEVPVDVRIIAATHQNLHQLVTEGKFREDLFYRLYLYIIELPPLRLRKEDIGLLAEYFLTLFSGGVAQLSERAILLLQNYPWPGNIRELKATIHRSYLIAQKDLLDVDDIIFTHIKPSVHRYQLDLIGQEKLSIIEALKLTGGNKLKAAEQLNIARSTLMNKIKKYGIDTDTLGGLCLG